MSVKQLLRLLTLVIFASLVSAAFVAKRDLDEIYKPGLYVYDPWFPLISNGPYSMDVAYDVAVLRWGESSRDDVMIANYEGAGYRVCPLGYDFIAGCMTDVPAGFGKFNVAFPVKGSINDLQTMSMPRLVLRGSNVVVEDVPVYRPDGSFNPEKEKLIQALTSSARKQYESEARQGVSERIGVWSAFALLPALLLTLGWLAYRWVRYGSLPKSRAS